ncbi:tRNA pseudouridine(38-40) synthase TruA [Leucobacter sp. cx-42]|uniref:tRNA pseudouridine(38-40) synthase TruA n=1 Tax=unclassified Leucobacter TaxID=2621730 RepID=UPI00165D924D|nr:MULTISPECIES: tRNA pseudouridine(38-40) synthase TruA [unclassified Leucobacter]MBC9954349.1 tRNA pseudouridine(38-40) synthase TruA [Leucobacter sp. cx-42]
MTELSAGLHRLRLDLAYDGTDFSGWAKQPGLRTVEGEIEEALALILQVAPGDVRITVGGRTDAGVHSRGQVAHIDVSSEQLAQWNKSNAMARRLNRVLSRSAPDVAIHSVREVPAAFDARFGALRRRYEYRVRPAQSRLDPLTARFTADFTRELDLGVMQQASADLLGLQDFTTFCKAREGATAVRELLAFEWRETADGAFAARIEADAFCHSMVRALVGSVVAVGSKRISGEQLRDLRDARERTSKFTVMPAKGLSLEEIAYPADEDLAARAEQTRARRDSLDD